MTGLLEYAARGTLDEAVPRLHLAEFQIGKNALQLYKDGHELYDAMLAAIDGAGESIYLECSLWQDDEVGRAFKWHLEQKAAQGVAVYVMCGGFGNRMRARGSRPFHSGLHILGHRSFYRPWHMLDPRRYAQDHRKLLVVDGGVGFIGGYNLGKRYTTGWRDTHLLLRGPAAAELAHAFIDSWNRLSVPHERIARRYPRQFDPSIVVRANDALQLTFPIRDMYIEAIDRAERTILLSNASFVPDRVLLDALKAAAQRGVDVEILVPWVSNHVIVDWLTRGHFAECLKAGIRIFGYRNMLHAKTCTIDGEWSTIGTANLDRLSSVGNYEINVEVYSKKLADQMEELFNCDRSNSFELTLEQWLKRPWYAILSERILSPLRALL